MRHLFLFEGLWAAVHLIGLVKGILICKCYQSVRRGVRSCTVTKLSNMATFHFYWLKWETWYVKYFFLFERLEGIAPSLSRRGWMEVKGGDPNVKKITDIHSTIFILWSHDMKEYLFYPYHDWKMAWSLENLMDFLTLMIQRPKMKGGGQIS